jgi:hypothetical protein
MAMFRIRLFVFYILTALLSLAFPGAGFVALSKGGGGGGKKGGGMPGTMPAPVEPAITDVQPEVTKPLSADEELLLEKAKRDEEREAERRRLYGASGTILTGSLGTDDTFRVRPSLLE